LWEYIFVSNARMEQDGLADHVESYQMLPSRDPKGVKKTVIQEVIPVTKRKAASRA
jgi:hypothetical protein